MKWSLQTRISNSISRLCSSPTADVWLNPLFTVLFYQLFTLLTFMNNKNLWNFFLEKPCFSYSQSERLECVNYTKHAHLSFLPVSELCWGHVLQRGAGAVCTVSLRDLPGHGGPVVLRAMSQHWSTGRRWSQERVPVWRWVTPNRKL